MSKFVKKVIPRIMKKGQHRLGSSGDAREKPRVPAGDEPTGTDQKAPIELNLPSKLVELNNSQEDSSHLDSNGDVSSSMEPESTLEEQSSLEHFKDTAEGWEFFWKQMNSLKSMVSTRGALVLALLILLGVVCVYMGVGWYHACGELEKCNFERQELLVGSSGFHQSIEKCDTSQNDPLATFADVAGLYVGKCYTFKFKTLERLRILPPGRMVICY